MKSKISLEKFDIECANFTIGQKNLGFHYRKADLYFIEDALIIVGFYTLFSKKIYRSFLVLTKEIEMYKTVFTNADEITAPDQLNLNSSNGEVCIQFGKSSFTSTHVSIRLKNLTDSEMEFISILKK